MNSFSCNNLIIIFAFVGISLSACNTKKNREGVEAAMTKYDKYILNMEVDSIALLYTPDGDMGGMAHGRDSIRLFLHSLKNIAVLSQKSSTDTISIVADSAQQIGGFSQVALIGGKDTVRSSGRYKALWQWNDGWYLKRMATRP